MQIQCPSCHARARLSEDHEGTKVRCAECGRVFVARALGGRRGPNTGLLIGGFAGALGLVVVVFVVRSCGAGAPSRAAQLEANTLSDPLRAHPRSR